MNDKLKNAATAAGGTLLLVHMPPIPLGKNGGCGARTHVEGTNRGTMPCGSLLTQFGNTEPYYCARCDQERKRPKYFVIVDCERVEPLINCANFEDAVERADLCWPNNHTWVSTKDSLRSLRKALNALDI
jgi:hypothetical protein